MGKWPEMECGAIHCRIQAEIRDTGTQGHRDTEKTQVIGAGIVLDEFDLADLGRVFAKLVGIAALEDSQARSPGNSLKAELIQKVPSPITE